MSGKYKIGKREYKKQFGRTFKGLTGRMFNSQKYRAKKYGGMKYTLDELRNYLINHKNFNILFQQWSNNNYDKDYTPSIDRINDELTYSLDNIQLMTWKENNQKGSDDRKKGNNIKVSKTVLQYDKDMNFIKEYKSLALAVRELGLNNGNVAACCRGLLKTSGGFKWKYKEGE